VGMWDARVKRQIRLPLGGRTQALHFDFIFILFYFFPQAGRSISKMSSPSNESHVRLRISRQPREGDHWSATNVRG
jgi:hypothetical protein